MWQVEQDILFLSSHLCLPLLIWFSLKSVVHFFLVGARTFYIESPIINYSKCVNISSNYHHSLAMIQFDSVYEFTWEKKFPICKTTQCINIHGYKKITVCSESDAFYPMMLVYNIRSRYSSHGITMVLPCYRQKLRSSLEKWYLISLNFPHAENIKITHWYSSMFNECL